MKKPDEIKRGVECCINGECNSKRKTCPYRKASDCASAVLIEALAYIREPEAKVAEHEKPNKPLTMEEIVTEYERTVPKGIDCAYVVEFRDDGYLTRRLIDRTGTVVVAAWNCDVIDLLFERDYGKTWRCWYRRPTEAERKAAKWDEDV